MLNVVEKNSWYKNKLIISVFSIWIFICINPGIELHTVKYISWYSAFIFFGIALLLEPKMQFKRNKWFSTPVLILFLGILTATFFSKTPKYNFIELCKLTIIFASFYVLNISIEKYYKATLVIFFISVFLNALSLIFIYHKIFLHPTLIFSQRHNSWLNQFGVLERGGSILYPYCIGLIMLNKRSTILPWLFTLLSIFIIIMDGSRTAFLYMIFITFLTAAISIYLLREKKQSIFSVLVLLTILLSILLLILFLPSKLHHENRLISTVQNILHPHHTTGKKRAQNSKSDVSNLRSIKTDSPASNKSFNSVKSTPEVNKDVRAIMYYQAWQKIKSQPFIGTGMGSTQTNVWITKTQSKMMNVHDAYLGIWGNAGIIGFVGLLLLLFIWIPFTPVILKHMAQETTQQQSMLISAIGIFTYCIINSLFNPFTTEWYIWIFYILAASYFWTIRSKVCHEI